MFSSFAVTYRTYAYYTCSAVTRTQSSATRVTHYLDIFWLGKDFLAPRHLAARHTTPNKLISFLIPHLRARGEDAEVKAAAWTVCNNVVVCVCVYIYIVYTYIIIAEETESAVVRGGKGVVRHEVRWRRADLSRCVYYIIILCSVFTRASDF